MAPPKTQSHPTEADLIFNRTAIALARSQRLIASWLPPTPPEEKNANASASASTNETIDDEDIAGHFVSPPERLGLGAPVPNGGGNASSNDSGIKHTSSVADERLRKTIMGAKRSGAKRNININININQARVNKDQGHRASSGSRRKIGGHMPLKRRPESAPFLDRESEGDDEEGRSSLGRAKRLSTGKQGGASTVDEKSEVGDEDGDDSRRRITPHQTSIPTKKRCATYLDEVLASRTKRKGHRTW